nr:unnamed protein product [Callosobruchus analis]
MYDGGQQGYSKGEMGAKDMKGDQGYYKGQKGAKKMYEDGKMYEGDQHYNKLGKNEGAMKMAKGHKKGHKIKGFKNSSQKLETGKTEEFYDEANDEGDQYMYNGQAGSFGEKAGSAYHGGKQEGKFNHESAGKEGHFNKGYFQDSHKGNSGRYGEKKFSEEGGIYGFNNGAGVTNMAGHDMHKSFFKKHPFYHNYY